MAADRTIAFDSFEVDYGRSGLRCDGVTVEVEPQVFDLIAYFATNSGRLLSRDDLIEHVWHGRIVSESAIASRINAVRNALGDDGKTQRYIKTIPRRGFRFERSAYTVNAKPPLGLPDKPSVAVLPFDNMSDDPEQIYFSDGITDDIITDLSRYDELFVIARHSSFTYRDSEKTAKEIAYELGVQYIAEGSVRRAGNRVRVTVQLIDPSAGNQLWADRYDRELEDIFAVQDEITAVIVNTLVGQIARQHYIRVSTKGPDAINAYDHLAKAIPHALKISPDDDAIARAEAEKAIAADPNLARAYSILSLTYLNEGANFRVKDPLVPLSVAYEVSGNAVAADPRDPWAHAMRGIADLWLNKTHNRALNSMRRAVDLNPSNSYFRNLYAYVLSFAGEAENALEQIDLVHRMNPHSPTVFLVFRGRALLFLRRLEEAMYCFEDIVTLMPHHAHSLGHLAICYAALDRLDEARNATHRIASIHPFYTRTALRRFLPVRSSEDLDFMLEMLDRAGLPD